MHPLNVADRLFNEVLHKEGRFCICLGHLLASVVKLASRRFNDLEEVLQFRMVAAITQKRVVPTGGPPLGRSMNCSIVRFRSQVTLS